MTGGARAGDCRLLPAALFLAVLTVTPAGAAVRTDVVPASGGSVTIDYFGAGAVMLRHGGRTVHIDPNSSVASYGSLPKADVILVTHEHRDSCDPAAIEAVRKKRTVILANEAAAARIPGAEAVLFGSVLEPHGITVSVVPSYNIVLKGSDGRPLHERGNGYVVNLGGLNIYVAGDTENIYDMDYLEADIAFLPMDPDHTMTPEMAADAARRLKPKILYPYRYGSADPAKLRDLLKDEKGIELRLPD